MNCNICKKQGLFWNLVSVGYTFEPLAGGGGGLKFFSSPSTLRGNNAEGPPQGKRRQHARGWGQTVSNKQNSSGGRVRKKRESSSEARIFLPL